MKIQIDIPQKFVDLAVAMLSMKHDGDDVREALAKCGDMTEVHFDEADERTSAFTGLAILAIASKMK